MNDNIENNPKLSDEQMDELLSVFYKTEMPSQLDSLPSSWPQISSATSQQVSPKVIVAPGADVRNEAGTASRGIAVAIATLAACVTIMVFSSSTPDPTSGTTDTGHGSDLMDVSENGNSDTDSGDGVVGNGETTLIEIQDVDLSPEAPNETDE